MDVLICVADGLIYEGLDYADRIEQRLTGAGLGCARYDLTDPAPYLPRPGLAYVFTGGQTSVHSDAEWMRAAIGLMRDLVTQAEDGGPMVIGVCLGSQLIAEALRPDSIIGSSGIEVGLTPVCGARCGDGEVGVVPSFHYQAITPRIEEVAGVRVEYRNTHTAVQALSYGERVFGCQFHPELSPEDIRRLIDFNADVIAEWNGNVAAAHGSVERHQGALSEDLFDRVVTDRIRHAANSLAAVPRRFQ